MPKSYRRAHVEISNVCNLQCHFCPEVERSKHYMEPEHFATLAPQLTSLVDEVCLHLMGEPLMHPKLAQFIEIAAQNQLPINLTTNGILLHGERHQLLLHPAIRQVNLSVHSFEANFGNKDPSIYLDRVFAFIRSAIEHRPDMYINLRLWDLTVPANLNERNKTMRCLIANEFGVDLDNLSIDLRRRKNFPLQGKVYLHFDSRFEWPSKTLPKLSAVGTCQGLKNHFGIHANGTVVPCCLDKEADLALGDSHQSSLGDILKSPRAEHMRQGFAKGELREDLCQRCPYVERFAGKAQRLRQREVVDKMPTKSSWT